MTLSFKHIGLLIGIALVFVSFLFFGRQQGTYQILLTSGLFAVFIFCLTILFAKGPTKDKVFWMAIIILFAVIQQMTEPFFIDHSYCTYISQNESVLTEVNTILLYKKGDVIVTEDSVFSKGDQLNANEKMKLKEGLEKLGVYQIFKSDKGLYYGLWGFLKVRLGITYLPGKSEPSKQYRHLTGNWFR